MLTGNISSRPLQIKDRLLETEWWVRGSCVPSWGSMVCFFLKIKQFQIKFLKSAFFSNRFLVEVIYLEAIALLLIELRSDTILTVKHSFSYCYTSWFDSLQIEQKEVSAGSSHWYKLSEFCFSPFSKVLLVALICERTDLEVRMSTQIEKNMWLILKLGGSQKQMSHTLRWNGKGKNGPDCFLRIRELIEYALL